MLRPNVLAILSASNFALKIILRRKSASNQCGPPVINVVKDTTGKNICQ
jgi:hypothetical protein